MRGLRPFAAWLVSAAAAGGFQHAVAAEPTPGEPELKWVRSVAAPKPPATLPAAVPKPDQVEPADAKRQPPERTDVAAKDGAPPDTLPRPTLMRMPADDFVARVGGVQVQFPKAPTGGPPPRSDIPHELPPIKEPPKERPIPVPPKPLEPRASPGKPALFPPGTTGGPNSDVPNTRGLTPPGSPGKRPDFPPAPPRTPAPPATTPAPERVNSLAKMCEGNCGGCEAIATKCAGTLHDTLFAPDPAYEPHWEPITAAAFFTDAPRPVTQTRVRWDYGNRLSFPDRGEFFWARADGRGKGPAPYPGLGGTPNLDYHELYLDQEIAFGPVSLTVAVPYRSISSSPFAASGSGFGDLQVTAKGLLIDSELFLLAAQFRTSIPTGNFNKGLGTGHVSLEPSVIAGLRVTTTTYAVAQVSEWIPVGGDRDYAGAMLRYSASVNQVLWRTVRDVQLIGSWEVTGFAFQDGLYTDPVTGLPRSLNGQAAVATGPGLRLYVGDKLDLGTGWTHGISGKAWMSDQVRMELRYRY